MFVSCSRCWHRGEIAQPSDGAWLVCSECGMRRQYASDPEKKCARLRKIFGHSAVARSPASCAAGQRQKRSNASLLTIRPPIYFRLRDGESFKSPAPIKSYRAGKSFTPRETPR